MAADGDSELSFSHLEAVLEVNTNFDADFKGVGQVDNMHSYM
jgi:hypothetical protein